MSCPLHPGAYEALIDEDIEWLRHVAHPGLERDHIINVLRQSVDEYRERGWMEDMTHTGWRHDKERQCTS